MTKFPAFILKFRQLHSLCVYITLSVSMFLSTSLVVNAASAENRLSPALIGEYTVGDVSADFVDLDEAFGEIQTHGIQGPVQLSILPGIYDTHTSLSAFTRHNLATDVLTIQSQDPNNRATLQHSAISANNNWIIQLEDVEYIDIKDIDFDINVGNTYSGIIAFDDNNNYIQLYNNTFTGRTVNPTGSTEKGSLIYTTSGAVINKLTVFNNVFTSGNSAINLLGSTLMSLEDISIINNQFIDQQSLGSYRVVVLDYIDNLEFSHNIVSNNVLFTKGVSMRSINGATIDANNIVMLGSRFGTFAMELLTQNIAGLTETRVTNNFLFSGHRTLTVTNSSKRVVLLFNTLLTSSEEDNTDSFCLSVTVQDGADIEVRKNIFQNTINNDSAMILSYNNELGIAKSNDNIMYGLSESPFVIETVPYESLQDYQLATNLDVSSKFMSVDFRNPSAGDLHLMSHHYNDINLLTSGLLGIEADIDGDFRPLAATHIGADEWPGDVIFINSFEEPPRD